MLFTLKGLGRFKKKVCTSEPRNSRPSGSLKVSRLKVRDQAGISFLTSKTAPLHAHLACSRHCETILHRSTPGGLPSAPARPGIAILTPCFCNIGRSASGFSNRFVPGNRGLSPQGGALTGKRSSERRFRGNSAPDLHVCQGGKQDRRKAGQAESTPTSRKLTRSACLLAFLGGLLQCPAMNIAPILAELKAERDQLDRAITALEHVAGSSNRASRPRARRKISAEGLARIRAAQKARWAKVRGKKKVAPMQRAKAGKRTMSASARRKIAAAQRARWAKLKRRKKNAGDDRATRL
jgi:hypothetical protein